MDDDKFGVCGLIWILSTFLFASAVVFSADRATFANAIQRKIPVYKVDTPNKVASLTFDAAWVQTKHWQF